LLQRSPAGEVVIGMRLVCMFASGPDYEAERLRDGLRGSWRRAARAVMVLLSLNGLPAAQIAVLLEVHPVTVRRWVSRGDDLLIEYGTTAEGNHAHTVLRRPRSDFGDDVLAAHYGLGRAARTS
jgi:hypothetical protein